MSLTFFSAISLLVICFVGYSHSWVFTDIDYAKLRTALADEIKNVKSELSDDDLKQLKFNFIYPGTKWCGPGNVADNYDDLGSAWQADSCCREHDNCPDVLAAGETRMNLTNDAFYTRLNCGCDETFRQCLHNANSSVALQIGIVYFDLLGTQCYREDYPITGCEQN
ncbi:phospholipase A2-like [Ostrinia nubilalis]|uniref:phospholipase A2-like n=1 Tax=Ostrinia nubilalis TaxID=29057 RepID=UPI00308232A2